VRRTSTLAVTLAALADTTATLPGLTCGELARVRAFVTSLRRERTGNGPAASDWSAEALPAVEVAHAVASEMDGLFWASGFLYWARQLAGNAETLEKMKEAETAVDAVIATARHHGVRVHDLQALTLLLRAHRDGEPPT
jgi:hypothetical protein